MEEQSGESAAIDRSKPTPSGQLTGALLAQTPFGPGANRRGTTPPIDVRNVKREPCRIDSRQVGLPGVQVGRRHVVTGRPHELHSAATDGMGTPSNGFIAPCLLTTLITRHFPKLTAPSKVEDSRWRTPPLASCRVCERGAVSTHIRAEGRRTPRFSGRFTRRRTPRAAPHSRGEFGAGALFHDARELR